MMSFRRCLVGTSLFVVLAIFAIGCSGAGNDESATVIGTWVNASYDTDEERPGKVVIASDYSAATYDLSTDDVPGDTGTYTIVEQTGNTYRSEYASGDYTMYSVVTVTATTMVGQFSGTGFPPQEDAMDITYTRQ